MRDIRKSRQMKLYWRSPEGKERIKRLRELHRPTQDGISLTKCGKCGGFLDLLYHCRKCG